MTAPETDAANVFRVDYANEYSDAQGKSVIPLVPVGPAGKDASIVFQTRTGKLLAYLSDDEELIVCGYGDALGIVVRPESSDGIKVVADVQ